MNNAVVRDLALLLGLALLLIATGLGLRDPWPADEPRFALLARDMVASGNWLFPQIGGDLYPDKPPLFFWLIAIGYKFTGSLQIAFLLPSLLAGLGTLVLVYDLGRRLWNREAGLWAALILLFTVQFTLQAKLAQIDVTLTFWSTLSLYALLRYLLLGAGWRWWFIGGFAAGLGVITKGVGFLPLLVLLPYAYARRRGWKLPQVRSGWTWGIAPLAFIAAIALWFVPMLIATAVSGDPALGVYRDEILFQQTVHRYAAAWHHNKPFYYYLTVIVSLWLPLALLLPWLVPRWIERLRARDARVLLLLGWVLLVLVFFSVSPGKRGVYILPALPALAVLSGEWLRGLWQRPDVQKTGAFFAALLVLISAAGFVYLTWIAPERAAELRDELGLNNLLPLAAIALIGSMALMACGLKRGVLASAWVLGTLWIVVSLAIFPQIDADRSGARFTARVAALADPNRELGLLAYKEQFLLHLQRSTVNFGHSRWREGPQESYDAARWLSNAPHRELLVPDNLLDPCFASATTRTPVGETSRAHWFLVTAPADPGCAARGDPSKARTYSPP